MTNTIGFTSDWHSLKFSQDFDGYLFVPLTAAGFTNLQLMADSNAYVGFHFEHKPNYAPEYFVDDIGTYYGTDVQAVLADLLAQRTDADYRRWMRQSARPRRWTHPNTAISRRSSPLSEMLCAGTGRRVRQRSTRWQAPSKRPSPR